MIDRIGLAATALLLALAGTLWARAEFHLGSGANDWQRFTVPDEGDPAGAYVTVDSAGNVLREHPVRSIEEEGGGTFLLEYNYRGPDWPDMEGGTLRAEWIDPMVNLARDSVLFGRGGSIYQGHNAQRYPTGDLLLALDGDPTTTRLMLLEDNPLLAEPLVRGGVYLGAQASAVIVNLGKQTPINRVRVYPRLGRVDDAAAIAAMAEPKPDPELFGETSFADNYLEWYEIAVTDNDAPIKEFPGSTGGGQRPGQGQFKRYSETTGYVDSAATDPNFDALIQTRENLEPVIDLRFPVRHERFVSVRPYIPERTWEMAEIEIYGEGYVRRSVYRSQILDFGQPVSWSKIRWRSERPPGTSIEVRTRTGNTPSPDIFLRRGVSGRYQRLDWLTFQQNITSGEVKRVPDVESWSFWSATYDLAAGERGEDPAAAWTDGTTLLSPGPSRYLQIEIVLTAASDRTPVLHELSLLFSEAPSAAQIIAEIWPIEVDGFEPHAFTYVVKPILRDGNRGFDRLEILTGGPAVAVSSVRVGGEEVMDRFPPEILEDRILLSFDRLEDPGRDNEKRIEVEFSARVLRFGAEFSGWVYDSREPDLKQSVTPGNATVRFVGDGLSVRTPTGGGLLQRLDIRPAVFTPNGDGVNDEAVLSFDLRNLTDSRPVEVRILALDGRMVRRLPEASAASGHFLHRWDGRNDAGRLVPPGVYLAQVRLDSDEGRKTATGLLTLAY